MSLILLTRRVKSFDSVGAFNFEATLGVEGGFVVAEGMFLLVGATLEGFVA